MANTLHAQHVIRDEEFRAAFIEMVAQNIGVFNQQSGIRLATADLEGYYAKTSFFDTLSAGVTRRDLTSDTTATALQLTTDEIISVKLFRTWGPYDFTLGGLRTTKKDPGELAFEIGQQAGQYAVQDMVNSACRALEAALQTNAGAKVEYNTAGQTITHARLNEAIGKFGDMRGMITNLVMHSEHYNDLVAASIALSSLDTVAGAAIIQGDPRVNLGRPIIVTDSSALIVADGVTSGTDTYVTLGLVPGGCTVTLTEPMETIQYFPDKTQQTIRVHGEFAYNVEVKGFKWDTTNGGANPTDAAVATATNWNNAVASIKNQAGVYLETPIA